MGEKGQKWGKKAIMISLFKYKIPRSIEFSGFCILICIKTAENELFTFGGKPRFFKEFQQLKKLEL